MSHTTPSRHEVWKMFNSISPTYDKVNRIMTSGFDRYWRKKMAQFLPRNPSINLLDIATGTGDQLISLLAHAPSINHAIGIDLATEMLHIARQKVTSAPFAHKVTFQEGDALSLPFPNDTFDCVTISFGIRNVTDVIKALQEVKRVLKPEGRLLILEATVPPAFIFRKTYLFYLRHLLPKIGAFLSGDARAYQYLNQTIETFPSGPAFCKLLKNAGFQTAVAHPLTFGSVTIYEGN